MSVASAALRFGKLLEFRVDRWFGGLWAYQAVGRRDQNLGYTSVPDLNAYAFQVVERVKKKSIEILHCSSRGLLQAGQHLCKVRKGVHAHSLVAILSKASQGPK